MTVIGTGQLSMRPDSVNILLEVITHSENLQEAQRENTERTNRVIRALIQLGVSQENIQTSAFNIQPMYDFEDGKQIFRDYEVTHTLAVNHKGVEAAGQIIDVAVQEGVNRVADIRFTVENSAKYENEALQLAVLDAERKAKTIATTLKVTVDLIPLRVTELSGRALPLSQQAFVKMESATPIEPGQMTLQATVEAEFQY